MAKQNSANKLSGTIGDITYYKTRHDGFLARGKGGVDGNRIKTDPRFARTRENGAEFGRAGAAGKLLRAALMQVIASAKDGRMTSRLTKMMMVALKADSTSKRGERTVTKGKPELLEGFEFNDHAELATSLRTLYTTAIDRATGKATITFNAFVPNLALLVPQGATHFRLVEGVGEVDFESHWYTSAFQKTAEMVIDENAVAGALLEAAFTVNSVHPVVVVLGVEFLQHVNGLFYAINNGTNNALAIVKVSGAV